MFNESHLWVNLTICYIIYKYTIWAIHVNGNNDGQMANIIIFHFFLVFLYLRGYTVINKQLLQH